MLEENKSSVGRAPQGGMKKRGRRRLSERWQKQPPPTLRYVLSPLPFIRYVVSHKNRRRRHHRPHHHTDCLPPSRSNAAILQNSRSTTEEEKCASLPSVSATAGGIGREREGNFLNGYPTNHEVSRPPPPPPMAISTEEGRKRQGGSGYINFDLLSPSLHTVSRRRKARRARNQSEVGCMKYGTGTCRHTDMF